jgi:hypothetical protein
MKRFKLLIFIITFSNFSLLAQDFPLTDFLNIYFNKAKYSVEQFQTDTTIKSKMEFLTRLKKFDPKSYADLNDIMQLNEHSFPQTFYITDLDNDGTSEYIITENYEGIHHLCLTFRDKKATKFLEGISFSDFLVKSPQKIWLVEQDTYIGWERSYDLLGMISKIYSFNISNLNPKYLFKLYNIDFKQPAHHYDPKEIVLNSPTRFYSDYLMSNQNKNLGIINKSSHGWILADTLNSYFAVFDSTTSYLNDSLGLEKITPKDRGYLMCWIPKNTVDLTVDSKISGLYWDKKTNEYLKILETGRGIIINYFTNKNL